MISYYGCCGAEVSGIQSETAIAWRSEGGRLNGKDVMLNDEGETEPLPRTSFRVALTPLEVVRG